MLGWYVMTLIKPTTHMSQLDQQWLEEFFKLFTAFLLVINLIFILPFLIEAPKLIYFVTRLIFGVIGACIAHVIKGFDLYDDLTQEQFEEGQDLKGLFYLRMCLLWLLVGFTIYATVSCICFACILNLCSQEV